MTVKARKRKQNSRIATIVFASMKSKDLQFDENNAISITAAKKDDGSEADGPAKFEMLAYSGAKMRPGGWYAHAPLIVDIAGMEFPSNQVVPVHRDHDTSKVVGHTTAIVAKNQLKLSGVVSADNAHAKEIVGSSKNAFPWQSSIGATLSAEPEYVDQGQTVFVNGRRHAGPVFVARKSRLFEASFVSLGADSRTSAVAASKEEKTMDEFRKWLEARGFDHDALSDKALATLQAQFDAENADDSNDDDAEDKGGVATKTKKAKTVKAARNAEAEDDGEDELEIARAERRKMIAAEYKREQLINSKLAEHPEIAAKAIEEGWNEDKIELAYLRATAARAPAIHSATQLREQPQAVEAALYLTAMIGEGRCEEKAVKAYGEKTVEVARKKAPRGAGLQWLCHQVIQAAGGYAEAGVFNEEHIRETFRAEKKLQAMANGYLPQAVRASSGFSTISLAGTLSNLANKQLLESYNAVPSVINKIARIANHSDFKSVTKYRTQTLGYLEKIGPTGEIQHSEMSEDTYANSVETFAKMLALTRQMLRNDDLDAFLQIPQGFGRMTATTKEMSFFSVLLNNTDNFFSAAPTGYNRNMLSAGGSSALSVTSLGVAEQYFFDQVDSEGKPISLQPAILLVDTSKKRDAENITQKTTVTVAGDFASVEQLQISNEYQGAFEPIASPWIHNISLTGASATQWWLFARPSGGIAAMEVAYLDGMQLPVIESAETDFNTLGIQWRCYHDWGIAKQDPRAGVRSPGA